MWGVANGVRTIGEGGQPIAYRGGEGVKKGQKKCLRNVVCFFSILGVVSQ